MGQTALSVNDHDDTVDVAGQAAAQYRSRGVPGDWYVDPADPDAGAAYRHAALDDAATAFLAEHEALADDPLADIPGVGPAPAQAVWIGLPSGGNDFSDEGELGWQSDALCAQTDPEAFFPEKGGSTRDAKKVCGACNVRAQCLEYALANDERFGIWGGLSERERRRLRKRAV
ncbi:WhiB family transcriptional regulator [Specibacter cremeus]|uniref:WhiB family transcriptional regulator n=1 Tax=Specibacter cremeus TaxID=1629051 RepID=UPI000F7799E3|nr:WhiB family transcriptional regulator [Specibacter cremeus]